jgi:putative hydrolase of the HAD superfamily
MSFRAVLFDWGGTLVRDDTLVTMSPAAAVAGYARKKLHLALRDEVFERAFQAVLPAYEPGVTNTSPRIDRLIALAFQQLDWTLDTSDIEACSQLFFDEACFAQDVYDDARAILSSLRYRGYHVGVVTNSIFPSALFTPWLGELGIAGYIDAFVSSADIGVPKPELAPYLAALAGINADPHEVLFVGDRLETDIAGARAAGMRAVLIDRTSRRREGAGYFVVSHLAALNDLLGEGVAR